MEWEWKLRGDGWEQLDAEADADADVDKRPYASRNSQSCEYSPTLRLYPDRSDNVKISVLQLVCSCAEAATCDVIHISANRKPSVQQVQ
jgi:hypothetical protein